MKKTMLLALLLCGFCLCGFSQSKWFEVKREFMKDAMQIAWRMPRGFIDENRHNIVHQVNYSRHLPKGHNSCGFYWVSAITTNLDCMILYSYESPRTATVELTPTQEAEHKRELFKAIKFGAPELERPYTKEWDKYVTVLDAKEAKKHYNADSVLVVDFPIKTPYRRYTHCIGVYMKRAGCPRAHFKCLLTDEGYSHKEEYMKRLRGIVKYVNNPRPYKTSEAFDPYWKVCKELEQLGASQKWDMLL